MDRIVAVVIPYYRGAAFLDACIASVQSADHAGFAVRIYIADNDPEENGLWRDRYDSGSVHRIKLRPHIGFGRACNAGVSKALSDGADFILLLNQDAELDKDCLKLLIEALLVEERELTVTCPIHYEEGFSCVSAHFIEWILPGIPELTTDLLAGRLKRTYPTDRMSAACIAFPKGIVRSVGLFDPLFFMYGEDDDLFLRLIAGGGQILLVPEAHLAHRNNMMSAQGDQRKEIESWRRRASLLLAIKHGVRKKIVSHNAARSYLKAFITLDLRRLLLCLREDLSLLAKAPYLRHESKEKLLKRIISQVERDSRET